MKKISCIGYHATGSGAVDDFLKEFDNVESAKSGMECRFYQDPDGISDLEYNLIENPHRLNSGFALKRFLILAKQEEIFYKKIFGKEWFKYAEEYINQLSEFSYKGFWRGDVRLESTIKKNIYLIRRGINLLLPKKWRKSKYYNYFPNIKTYVVNIDEGRFLDITQKYSERLCGLLNKEGKEFVILDQVASAQNINRYLRYINDLKVIIVDRDPRDVYLSNVIINKDVVLPKNVEQFCEVYKMSRKMKEEENGKDIEGKVLRINFEDMIYKYEDTTKRILNFLDLNEKNHLYVKKYFDPAISIKNTKLWENNLNYEEEIKYIKNNLSNYLYNYHENIGGENAKNS